MRQPWVLCIEKESKTRSLTHRELLVSRLAKDSLINRVEAEREIQYRLSSLDAQFSEFWRFLTANALQQNHSVNYQYFPRSKLCCL
jgi:hypothetical protein